MEGKHVSLVDWSEYLLVNTAAASAIALDACILILLRFRDLSTRRVVLQWSGAIGLTHATFPMLGFIGGWFLIEQFNLAAGVYSLGAILLGLLICFILRESTKPNSGAEGVEPSNRAGAVGVLVFWIPVIYVSLDALLSGPGKTVLLERYPKELAWVSFVLVGLLVALFTLIAGGISRTIHISWIAGRFTSPARLAHVITAGILGELSLFSFFLVWCLVKVAEHLAGLDSLAVPFSYVVITGLVLGGAIIIVLYSKIKTVQLQNAESALARRSIYH